MIDQPHPARATHCGRDCDACDAAFPLTDAQAADVREILTALASSFPTICGDTTYQGPAQPSVTDPIPLPDLRPATES